MKIGKKSAPVAVAAAAAIMTTMISTAFAISGQLNKQPSDNPWDYTLLASGGDESLIADANTLTVAGDMRANGGIGFGGENVSVSGLVVASGTVRSDVTSYEVGRMIKCYVSEVRNGTKSTQIILSRSHPGLVKKLFFQEVTRDDVGASRDIAGPVATLPSL